MTPLYFLPNSLSDPSFEAYLQDTHRFHDYLDVKDKLLPKLFESIEQFSKGVNTRFLCVNRFEGQNPALRIQSPAGFVPDVIYIEFPPPARCIHRDSNHARVQSGGSGKFSQPFARASGDGACTLEPQINLWTSPREPKSK